MKAVTQVTIWCDWYHGDLLPPHARLCFRGRKPWQRNTHLHWASFIL